MQFNQDSAKVSRRSILKNSNSIRTLSNNTPKRSQSANVVSHSLQMYVDPPGNEISIVEFDEIALQRLHILKIVEDMRERFTVGSDDYNKNMIRELANKMPIAAYSAGAAPLRELEKNGKLEELRERDRIGHFILRLAFCRSPESQKWFIQNEVDLFRFRFLQETKKNVVTFLAENKIQVEPVSERERDDLSEELAAGCSFTSDVILRTMDFWKIDFVDACDLVRRRKCYLKRGMAYLPHSDLQVIVCSQLRIQIAAAMNRAFKHLGMMEEGSRLLPRLARLANNAYSGKEYAGQGQEDKITRHMLDGLCATSFPLCMRVAHTRFRADHHMRHGGRRQYGLFLKAIGLSLDEAMMFMREEFTKKIDADKFEKQYSYNIRHMYGKEGRRMEYPALPCSAIILGAAPTAQDCHGCPYKHNEPQMLTQRLQKDGFNKQQIDTILAFTKNNQFDKACTRHFEFMHKMNESSLGQTITHPNQYFELSQEVLNGKRQEEHVQVFSSEVKKEEAKEETVESDFDD